MLYTSLLLWRCRSLNSRLVTSMPPSQDCLLGLAAQLGDLGSTHPPLPSTRCDRHRSGRSHPQRPPQCKPKTSQSPRRRKTSSPEKKGARVLVMEEVRILKRGEELKAVASPRVDVATKSPESLLRGTFPLFLDQDNLPRKLGLLDLGKSFAGPGFFASPSPSSIPLPSFLLKRDAVGT